MKVISGSYRNVSDKRDAIEILVGQESTLQS